MILLTILFRKKHNICFPAEDINPKVNDICDENIELME